MLDDKFIVEVKYTNTQALIRGEEKFWEEMHSLPANMSPDFFSHPDALQAWLSTTPHDTKFVISRIKQNSATEGIALFAIYTRKLGHFWSEKTLSLLRSGDPELDQCWPEYVQPRCKDFVLPLIQSWWQETLRLTNCHLLEVKSVQERWLTLCSNDNDIDNMWIERKCKSAERTLTLPLNWSKKIQRQLRQTETYAKVHLGNTLQLEEVLPAYYQDILWQSRQWHINKWNNTETPSALLSPCFNAWLSRMLERSSIPKARMFRASTGPQTVGICIILDSKPWAGFYLASLLPQDSNHWHIGTWLHCRVAEIFQADNGYDTYDFMDGDSGYKHALGNHSVNFLDITWFNRFHWRSRLQMWLIKRLLGGNIINNNRH